MRKRFLLTTIIILMLSCTFVTSFAINNSLVSVGGDVQFEMEVISPNSMYMPLVLPQLVAVNSDYTVAVSAHELAVYHIGDYTKIALSVKDGYYPKSVAIVANYLLIMYESGDLSTTYLNLWDIAKGSEVSVDFQGILGEDIQVKAIDEDNSTFYLRNKKNELIAMTIDDGVANGTKVADVNINTMSNAVTFDMVDGQLYIYNGKSIDSITSNSPTPILKKEGILDFSVTHDGIMIISDKKIGYYPKEAKVELTDYNTETSQSAYYYDNSIYYCDIQNSRVKVLSLGAEIIDSGKYYGDRGSEVGRYDTPQDVAINNGNVYVADSNNNRISIFNSVTHVVSIAGLGTIKPLKIAVYGENIAIYDGVSIGFYQYNIGKLTLISSLAVAQIGNIINLTYHHKQLVALTDSGGIYSLNSAATKIYELVGAKQIVSNSNSNHLYIVAEKLLKLNMKTLAVDFEYEFDSTALAAIVLDYSGAIFSIDSAVKNLKVFNRENGAYSEGETYAINRLSVNISMTMDMQSGDIYIIDRDMHKLVRVGAAGIGAKSIEDIGYEHSGIDAWTVIEAGKIKADTYLYSAPNNDEAIEDITVGNVLLVFNYLEYNGEKFAYGCVKGMEGKFYYIKADQLEMLSRVDYPSNHPTMTAVFPSGADIKQFPMRASTTLAIAKRPTEILLINNVAGDYNNHIWQWFKVSYKCEDGTIIIGYIDKNDAYYTAAITPPKNRVFLKVQTEGLGKTVLLYKEPNAQSEVLFSDVSDGEKVILCIEKFDSSAEFTKVIYNNTVGFIYTANLLQSGLTESQTITIVVSVICVVIFIVLIVLLILRKKLFNKSASKTLSGKKNNNMQ